MQKNFCDRCQIEILDDNQALFMAHAFTDSFNPFPIPYLCESCLKDFQEVTKKFLEDRPDQEEGFSLGGILGLKKVKKY